MDYILGLDLGTSSIGWAVVRAERQDDAQEWEGVELVRAGVRIFEEGILNEKGKEKSRAENRTAARRMRRTHRRRNDRRREFLHTLQEGGLLPAEAGQLSLVFRTDPYLLRAKALDEPLTKHEFGRALYHLCQRRGFKSNRKSGKAKDTKYIKEMNGLVAEIEGSGFRTLGEFLTKSVRFQADKLAKGEARRRVQRTTRAMYEQEFDAIWNSQLEVNAELATDEFEKLRHALRKIMFKQHHYDIRKRFGENLEHLNKGANAWRSPQLGTCELIPGEPRCPRDLWVAQRFRILQETANLRIQEPHQRERWLTLAERRTLFDALMLANEMDFDQIGKKLKLRPGARFNLQRGERRKLKGNSIEYELKLAFKANLWEGLPDDEKQVLRDALAVEEDDDALRALLAPYGLDEKRITRLCDLGASDKYARYSQKAIRRMLPLMELDGGALNLHDARKEANFEQAVDEQVHDVLPALDVYFQSVLPITNPVVVRALSETRKVVNALIREYGKPARTIVELAREMDGGEEHRKQLSKMRQNNEDHRNTARQALQGAPWKITDPSRDDITRYLLWREQGPSHHCPYSGATIGQELLFSNSVEVDHILPRWRSLDDSYMNKVVCLASANAEKGNETPFEKWHGTPRYDEIIQRIESKRLPRPKLRRFYQEELDVDAWAKRYLNDTRYISREVVKYLNLLYPRELRVGQKAVGTSSGSLTHELRRNWGLNNICDQLVNADGVPLVAPEQVGDESTEPEKSRADHRHHAVDAIVVALSSRRRVQAYANYYKVRAETGVAPEGGITSPWPILREDAAKVVQAIKVSHRPSRQLNGALHEDLAYGAKLDPDGTHELNKAGLPLYTTRVTLDKLNAKNFDPENKRYVYSADVRAILKQRFDEHCGKKGWWEGLRMPNGSLVRRVRLAFPEGDAVPVSGPGHDGPFKFFRAGGNHHIEIFSFDGELKAMAVHRFEAVRRKSSPGEAVVRRQWEDGQQLVLCLMIGDSVEVDLKHADGSVERILCVVQQIGGNKREPHTTFKLLLKDARDARLGKAVENNPFKLAKSTKWIADLNLRKVQVDPTGKISEIGPGRV